jgi:hypothetical protein
MLRISIWIGILAVALSFRIGLLGQNVIAWGDNTFGQCDVPPAATNVVAMAAGDHHSLALRADGTLVGWGDDSYGQISIPPSATNIVAISAAQAQSMALTEDGRVILWGDNSRGLLTFPRYVTNVASISISDTYGMVWQAEGVHLTWGAVWPPDAIGSVAGAAGSGWGVLLGSNHRAYLLSLSGLSFEFTNMGPVTAVAAYGRMCAQLMGSGFLAGGEGCLRI